MPSFFFCATKAFRALDLFPNSKLLRYNGQSQYTTTSGGIISAVVLAIFIVLFASMGVKTVKREIISSSVYTESLIEPGSLTVTNGPGGDFMLGIFIYGINLNLPVMRFFDVTLQQETYSSGYVLQNITNIPLEQCTKEHFSFNTELTATFARLPLTEGLCPSIGQKFEVQGKISSDLFKQFRVGIRRCNATTNPSCAPDVNFTMVESMIKQFTLVSAIINLNINPGNEEYKTFYFEDKNHFTFNTQLGVSANAFIQQDTIETDVSIMPYQDIVAENVTRVPESFTPSYYIPKTGQNLAEVLFQKSTSTSTYSRSFNKIDAYFSYVGGLVGTILGLIFIMGFYTQKAYELSLAKKIFVDEDKKDIASSSFNIGYYLCMVFKKLLDYIKIKPNWTTTQSFIDSCEEISMQIDITYIVRRLNFLDSAISKLLEKHELQTLYLREKPSLSQLKDQRRLHFARELWRNHKREESKPKNEESGGQDEGGANIESKQQIVVEEGDIFNQECNQTTTKKAISQDPSAIEFSEREEEIQNIKASIIKVARESKRGRNRSRQIIKDLDPATLQALGMPDDFNYLELKSQKIREEEYPIQENESVQEIDFNGSKMKPHSHEFQYNFQK